jgi:hypothetical protein
MSNGWQPSEEWVLRVPLIDGGDFLSKDHTRIQRALNAVLEHMEQASVASRGHVRSGSDDVVASWKIEKIRYNDEGDDGDAQSGGADRRGRGAARGA